MKILQKNIRFFTVFFPIIYFTFAFAVFYRSVIASGFDLFFGDSGDARFNLLIIEHWFDAFKGLVPFKDTRMFFPYTGTVGYSDLSLGYVIFCAFFKLFGADYIQAYQLSLFAAHLVGVSSFYFFLKSVCKYSLFASIIGTTVAFFSNAFFLKVMHTQFFSVGFVPLTLIFGVYFFKSTDFKNRLMYGFSCISIFLLILYTSFYVAFFFAFFVFVMALIFFIRNIRLCIDFILKNAAILLILLFLSGILLIPFAIIYIPVLKMNGARSLAHVAFMTPYWYDFFNVSYSNVLWGKLLQFFFPHLQNRLWSHEIFYGFAFFTFLLLIFSFFVILKKNKKKSAVYKTDYSETIFVATLALLVCCILLVKFDIWGFPLSFLLQFIPNGFEQYAAYVDNFKTPKIPFTLWYGVFLVFPGASVVRAVGRFLVILHIPAAIIISYALNKYVKSTLLLVVLTMLIFAEQTNTNPYTHFSRTQTLEQIQNVPKPPQDCTVFAIYDPTHTQNRNTLQLDAVSIATYYKLHTLNGYSGVFPKNWQLLNNDEQYVQHVTDFIAQNKLQNVYGYNIVTKKWFKW